VNRRGPSRWWIGAAGLLVVAAVCLGFGLQGHRHPLAGPVMRPASASAPAAGRVVRAAAPSTTSVPPIARSVPVSLQVPTIGVSTSLSALGLNATGTVQVPTNDEQPGWYELGPTPGQTGSSVILGHVDTFKGPGVFFRLRTLEAGDQVDVTLADGTVVRFAVSTVAQYTKAQFPDQEVYASHGFSGLQLVTCGGTFDSQTGHYLSNIVVYTTLVGTSPAPTG
jgi:sortase (surface protein transpeptidase)